MQSDSFFINDSNQGHNKWYKYKCTMTLVFYLLLIFLCSLGQRFW